MAGTMRPMELDETPLYGPRGLLVCGLNETMAKQFLSLLGTLGWDDLPVSFAGRNDLNTPVGQLFTEPVDNREALGGFAVIMGGITGSQLQQLMKSWRESSLPRTLWATLTETSVNWPLLTLLRHLAEEQKEMAESRHNQP
ncbi:hypothetical protein DSLASN_18790 [Desulfoluna limicola]|uniref:DUF3783 domain-containing protein n=1 Tax=Desulfoluna limicola TaxID=2810562 RepID=A0ABM7PGJ9_9BACT|nr:DUF3783 domain-containing protein [Desulfoluna limicola]BCS96247.1 hypothetical protein DSLASN_18790 [Desulfoluna limicola]